MKATVNFILAAAIILTACNKSEHNPGGGSTSNSNPDTSGYSYNDSTTVLCIPNAFTPNGDGINDRYAAIGVNYSQFHLTIKEANGVTIYSSSAINAYWDGRIGNT